MAKTSLTFFVYCEVPRTVPVSL